MAAASKKASNEMKEYIVTLKANLSFCGQGAGGAQFAHGEAKITDSWLAEWFKTHEGYDVKEVQATEKAE